MPMLDHSFVNLLDPSLVDNLKSQSITRACFNSIKSVNVAKKQIISVYLI